MKRLDLARVLVAPLVALASFAVLAQVPIQSRMADADGLQMHYLEAGEQGSVVILLHGYAQNSHMWRPLMRDLRASAFCSRYRSAARWRGRRR